MPDSNKSFDSDTASTSLVLRLRLSDQAAWSRLMDIYAPLVYRWGRRSGLQPADAEDVVGEVFADVARSVGGFQADGRPQSFRRWLRTITSRRISKNVQKRDSLPGASGGTTANVRMQEIPKEASHELKLEVRDEAEWVRQRALRLLETEYEPSHWDVFRRVCLDGEAPKDVAESAEMTVWAVYKIQARILHRLRTELDEPY
jgi:RNA polymerase sigma-70 factor (ECF subfamily)